MKKKLLILSASIGLLLACFPFTLCAEEDPQSDLGISAPLEVYQLDSYFYNNYDLLPYIESSGAQYINTGVQASNDLLITAKISDLEKFNNNNSGTLFGSRSSSSSNKLYVVYNYSNNQYQFQFNVNNYNYNLSVVPYSVFDIVLDKGDVYLNNNLIHEFTDSNFSGANIFIFGLSDNGSINSGTYSKYKLYSFSIYDYSANDGEGAYVKYYYPAKAKSGGTIGLYDSISKTFISTATATPFASPVDDQVIGFQISNFITAGLGWIGDILDFAISEPLIICFMAIGLAGAMFRWGRRLVHF